MDIGKKKHDESYARLQVLGKNKAQLDKILELTYREGATSKHQTSVKLKPAPSNMVMPKGFYSTTNNYTKIYLKKKWIKVQNTMMDKCIVVKKSTATCVAIRDVQHGDLVVVGEEGISVVSPVRPREGANIFEFMGSGGSSERPTQHIARKLAKDIVDIKKSGGKVVLVGGPAIVHTGAADAIADLIKHGYIGAVLAGNALAVHDIEYATIGTSLGMNVKDGTLAVKGHRNHMDAINSVFASGSIKNMVKKGNLKKGIMYELKRKIPFVLAGSITTYPGCRCTQRCS